MADEYDDIALGNADVQLAYRVGAIHNLLRHFVGVVGEEIQTLVLSLDDQARDQTQELLTGIEKLEAILVDLRSSAYSSENRYDIISEIKETRARLTGTTAAVSGLSLPLWIIAAASTFLAYRAW